MKSREGLDVVEGHLAGRRHDLVAERQLGERLAERMPAVLHRGARVPHPGQRGQHLGRALDRGALHVVQDRADAAELFAAACAPRSAVDEVRHRRAVSGRRPRVLAAEEQDASVEGADPAQEFDRDIRIVGGDARDERSAAAIDELGGLGDRRVREHARDRAERLDLVDGLGRGIRESDQDRRHEGALGGGADRAVRAHDVGSVGRAQQDATAGGLERRHLPQHLVALLERDQRTHRDGVGPRIADHDPLVDLGLAAPRRARRPSRPARWRGGSPCTSARPWS